MRCSNAPRSSPGPSGAPAYPAPKVFPLNLPNTLTVLRILLVPVVVVALLDETPNGDAIAAGVFALAALTDGLDGWIARNRGEITTFGKLMDPLADKLLVTAALVSLVSLRRRTSATQAKPVLASATVAVSSPFTSEPSQPES